MMPELTNADEAKPVVHEGDTIGMIVTVEHGTAHVEPDPGLTDKIKANFGWGDTDEETYPLQDETIAEVTDNEVRLQSLP